MIDQQVIEFEVRVLLEKLAPNVRKWATPLASLSTAKLGFSKYQLVHARFILDQYQHLTEQS